MKIKAYQYSHVGGKKENEDSYGIRELENGICTVVADGLGSHGGGKQASEIAVRHLLECAKNGGLPAADEIMNGFVQANEEILRCRESESHMKTTAVFLYLKDNTAVWAHIGDSRLYHFYNWELKDYTLDHSVSQMAVALGEIERWQIPGHVDRSRLLRVVGDDEIKPEIHEPLPLQKGCHAFLLCTDGFWEYVTEDEMLLDLSKAKTPKEWIHSLQYRHERRVETNHDNHTAVAVYLIID